MPQRPIAYPLIKHFLILYFALFSLNPVKGQNYTAKSVAYNGLVGALTGGIGAVINKHAGQKWHKAFAKGFVTGTGGGLIMYCGKKMNFLVADRSNLFYGRAARLVFSAGNSIVENAAANRPWWSQAHYDVGFIRMNFRLSNFRCQPQLMPSALGGMLFIAFHGEMDVLTTLKSGTFTFRSSHIDYAGHLVGSTTSNGFLLVDTLTSTKTFYEVYAHESVHTFQFQEFSGINYFAKPITDNWKATYPLFRKVSRWIYWDINYEAMLVNYFIVQGGYGRKSYCRNFLENEAEVLTTGRISCPK